VGNSRELIACPSCGANKNRKTHTFGSYKVYRSGTIITLKCKTCKYEMKFRIIRGGYIKGLPYDKVNKEDSQVPDNEDTDIPSGELEDTDAEGRGVPSVQAPEGDSEPSTGGATAEDSGVPELREEVPSNDRRDRDSQDNNQGDTNTK
jgi:transcription elongation factor Elf1